jgi:hypothetical protein
MPAPKPPIALEKSLFVEKSAQVLVTFTKIYKSSDIRGAFKAVLIQPSIGQVNSNAKD